MGKNKQINKKFPSFYRHFGSFIAAIASLIVYKGFNAHELGLWRVLFFIGGVSAIPFIILRKNIPESPRWLIIKGNNFLVQ